MANCGQACPYNTLDGCKVKEYNVICPLTNMATPVTEYRMTNADRIRAMSDEELARFLAERNVNESTVQLLDKDNALTAVQIEALRYRIYCALVQWLKQPADNKCFPDGDCAYNIGGNNE